MLLHVVVSLLIVVLSMQKSMTSSLIGDTFSFVSLLFSFDVKVEVGCSSVLSEVWFL